MGKLIYCKAMNQQSFRSHPFKIGLAVCALVCCAFVLCPAQAASEQIEIDLPYGLELYHPPDSLPPYDPLYPLYWSFDLGGIVRDYNFDIKLPQTPSYVPACWYEVSEELIADGLDRAWVEDVFTRLGSCFTETPMKTKLAELYKIKFGRKKTAQEEAQAKQPKQTYYRHVITEKNALRAMNFLETHSEIFAAAEARYGVPKEVAVSLILVETDLGSYFGKKQALLNLASMASSRTKDPFYKHLPKVAGDAEKEEWMQEVLDKRSAWAYEELTALLAYSHANRIDPLELCGSVYGAVGYCQFMPSNILRFGVDGSGDGTIDLFDPADAIPSLSNYLMRHGWQPGLDEAAQRKVLLEYNRSTAYANTILMMAAELAKRQKKDDTES